MKVSWQRWLRVLVLSGLGMVLLGGFALACTYVYLAPSLPTAQNAQLVPLSIFDRSGHLISQIGEERRKPLTYEQIPVIVRQAVVAAEDDRFFEHHGLDWKGVLRAFITNVASADASGQGGSTITQQAARNLFLTLDKNLRRKLSEVFVTYRMEHDFTKEQILTLYLNVALFGQRSIGIGAAAETYYGKELDQLSVSQVATLVGVLPAPSRYNPVTNPRLAEKRRNYVLGRMKKLGNIDARTAEIALKEPVATHVHAPKVDVYAPYVAEMARQFLVSLFGPAAVNQGYKVFTTIDGRLQAAANHGLQLGLVALDRRHGFRGKLGKVVLSPAPTPTELELALGKFEPIGILQPAVVTKVGDKSAEVYVRSMGPAKINWDGLSWARVPGKNGEVGPAPRSASEVVMVGDVNYVVTDGSGITVMAQLPKAQSALVALDPEDGAVVSLVGGFDYFTNKYNRAVQAQRQPGSGFKPFVYSAALEHGFTPSSIILDAPVLSDSDTDGQPWRLRNSDFTYNGPMRLREALVHSRNPVAIRILQSIGVDTVIEHATKFGFRKEDLPRVESLAIGTQSASPMEMVTGYAVFANGGFKVDSYFIDRIEDANGKVVFEAKPKLACIECEAAQTAPPAVAPGGGADSPSEAAPAPEAPPAPDKPLHPNPVIAAALAAVPTPAPHIRDVDAPASLRELARVQGGRGLLAPERLAPRVISPQNAWLMGDILHDVTTRGTAVRSKELGRNDLAGKTGTNGSRDNWFNGFTRHLVASVWVGFDDEESLGAREEGARTALPIWDNYMREALRGVPEERLERPGGLVDLRVSPTTGVLANPFDPSAINEIFMVDHLPKIAEGGSTTTPSAEGSHGAKEPVF